MISPKLLVTLIMALLSTYTFGQWMAVETFEDPNTIDENWELFYDDDERRVDPNDPPYAKVVTDPWDSSNNVMEIYPGNLVDLNVNLFAALRIPEEAQISYNPGGKATFYLRHNRPIVGGRSAEVDTVWGLMQQFENQTTFEPEPDPITGLLYARSYGHYSIMSRIEIAGYLEIRDELALPQYLRITPENTSATNVWYEMWYVIDHAANTFKVYVRGGPEFPGEEPVLAYGEGHSNENFNQDATYRNKGFNNLAYIMFTTSLGGAANPKGRDPMYFDAFYIDPNGENLTSPDAFDGGPEPVFWNGFGVSVDGWVDTGSWMGQLNVAEAPWVYSTPLSTWLYMPENAVQAEGGWSFVIKR